jgi:hypothetical protein
MRNQIRYIVAGVVVVVAVVVIIFATQSPSKKASGPTTTTTPTTTTPTGPIAPLTGLPDPGGAALTRPALTVKIENDPNSHPQWGVDQADVVYEEIVNGGITRLAAIFNQNAPAKIGPVRSVRPTDAQIVWPLGGLFAYSGGAPYAVNVIATAPVKLIDESAAGNAMFRDPNRVAPYNLYGVTPQLFKFGGKPVPPQPLFLYRPLGQPAVGPTVTQFTVPFQSIYPITWKWDTKTHSWDRYTNFNAPAAPDIDLTGSGTVESPKNVIVMYVNYPGGGPGAFTSYADLQSGGVADVFTDGKEITGTWARPDHNKAKPIAYIDSKGKAIRLTPGQTWVELLDKGAPAMSITH